MTHYDLLVIGTGSGNSIVDDRFTDLSVAIAEEWHFGGTCLNVGCIPTKMFVLPASVATAARDASRLNLDTAFNGVDWPGLQQRIFGRIDAIEADGRDYRTNRLDNVTVYPTHVHFTGRNEAQTADGETITFDRVVIATGSHPAPLHVPGLDWQKVDTDGYPVVTSDSVMRLPALPTSLVIVGSGYIAAEFAHVFASLGVQVTVLARKDRLLTTHDPDVSRVFTDEFVRHVDVRFGVEVDSIEVAAGQAGLARGVKVSLQSSGHVQGPNLESIEADLALVAIGRKRSSAALNLGALGADLDGDRIVVDAHQRVLSGGQPLAGVYALGDVCSPYMLKHVANHEARVVQHNLLVELGTATARGGVTDGSGETLATTTHDALPAAVFSHPQIGSVGATEPQLRAAGVDYVAYTQEYAGVAYGWALNDDYGIVKVLADRHTKQFLGAHVVGEQAPTLVQLVVTAMAFGIPVDRFASEQYWAHPALAEVIENATLGLKF